MPEFRTLAEVQDAIRRGALSCAGLVEAYLAQIEATRNLNIYIAVYAEEALDQARRLDERLRSQPEQLGRLFGLVVSLKDVLCHEGHAVTAGSRILQGFTSLYSATAVERLLQEDAIIIGRVNCDEFAMGSANENSFYGPTRNAADPERVPGGSSGASAVSVQAGTCLASLGSDTGGSVRQPAAFCGVVGFKPTYGRISRHGLIAYGSSLDQIGILARSVEDVARMLAVMAGPDDYDATAAEVEVPAFAEWRPHPGAKRIAYIPQALDHPSLDAGIRQMTLDRLAALRADGHVVEAVQFELLDYLVPAYYVLASAEASSNLSRYDGVRYGYRSPEACDLESTYRRSRTEGFGAEVKRRIMLGTFVLSAGYYDAYYTKAQQIRQLIREQMEAIFLRYDFLLMPATPGTAWRVGEGVSDPVAVYLADIFTVQANLAGIPAIALPLGVHPDNGLPVGVQLMARAFEEHALLAFCGHIMAGKTHWT
jgi:aspartyl-tRNA(Asn)/glutamyl-tRNA(Gln) amidotransferase subunit A